MAGQLIALNPKDQQQVNSLVAFGRTCAAAMTFENLQNYDGLSTALNQTVNQLWVLTGRSIGEIAQYFGKVQ